MFTTAFLLLNALDLCRNINIKIAVNESLMHGCFENGEIGCRSVLRYDARLATSLWGGQHEVLETLNHSHRNLRKWEEVALCIDFDEFINAVPIDDDRFGAFLMTVISNLCEILNKIGFAFFYLLCHFLVCLRV